MVDDGEGSFKRPGAVPFDWEIRPGIPKTRTPQPDDDPTLLQPSKKLSPLRFKQLPPSNQSSPSSPKTRAISPFAPPPSSFQVKPPPAADSDRHSSGPPTPYFRCSSPRLRLDTGAPLRRWRLLKSLIGLKKSKSRDVKKICENSSSSESSDIFYESETAFSSPSEGSRWGSVATSWSSPQSSLSSSRRGSTLKRNKSDLSSSEKKSILMMSRERLG